MKKSVDEVLSNKMGYKKAAREYCLPQTTLERYVQKLKQGNEVIMGLPLGPIKSVFSQTDEEELVEYLKYMVPQLLYEGRKKII